MMNKISSIILLAIFSTAPLANQNEAMIDFAMQMMKQKGEFQQLSQCTGVPAAKLEKAMRGAMKNCIGEEYMQNEAAGKQCSLSYLTKETGLTESQFEACRSPEDKLQEELAELEVKIVSLEGLRDELSDEEQYKMNDEIDMLYEKQSALSNKIDRLNMSDDELAMEEIYAQIGDKDPSPQQMKKLKALSDAQQKARMQQMGQIFKVISKASEMTTGQITLPVYPNSQVISHMTQAGEMQWGDLVVKTLPAATFSSSDDIETIVKFYKKQLPNYKLQRDQSGDYLFMESMSDNFDVLRNIREFSSTPHVNISIEKNKLGILPEGTKVVLEIAYRL